MLAFVRSLLARLWHTLGTARANDDVREELQAHLAMHAEYLERRGLPPDEARRQALLDVGGITATTQLIREHRGIPMLAHLGYDVRHTLRALRRQPGYALAVILTLALGIGANAATFALVNAAVLRPLPYPEPERIIAISRRDRETVEREVPSPTLFEWTRSSTATDRIAAFKHITGVLDLESGAEEVRGLRTTDAYFPVFGLAPIEGRVLMPGDLPPDGAPVMVLSEQLWRGRFGADRGVIGRQVRLDDTLRTIIGVMPAALTTAVGPQYWLPLRVREAVPERDGHGGEMFSYGVVARLRDGQTPAAARAELDVIHAREKATGRLVFDGSGEITLGVVTLHQQRYGDSRTPLLLVLGAAVVLLLIACANIANLALARSARRQREFAVRMALGAGRGRIIGQVLIESLGLAAAGATLGLLAVKASLGILVRISPGAVGRLEGAGVDLTVFGFAVLVAVVAGLLFGLVPAISAARGSLHGTLTSGSTHATSSRAQTFLRRALVVGQLATALVFLTGAGLVARTFWRVTSIDTGFQTGNLLVANLGLRASRYNGAAARAFYDDLQGRVRAIPGVRSLAYTDASPLRGARVAEISVSTSPDGTQQQTRTDHIAVGADYFRTVGATVLQGRPFGPEDHAGGQQVAVVNETFAKERFPGGAVGQTLNRGQRGPQPLIVGVIRDLPQGSPSADAAHNAVVFRPLAQTEGRNFLELMVRTTGKPEQLEGAISGAVRAIDPTQPPPSFTTVERQLSESVAPRKFVLVLLTLFAALAGSLAVLGLYAVLAYLVAERTREIGVRLALGADAARVTRMVLRQGAALVAIGAVLGVGGSLVAVRVLKAVMYETSVYDAPTFAAVAGLLCAVGLLASWIPARRASRVDPVIALRAD